MPIYEYRCGAGHNFEVIQGMADDPISKCEVCGEPVERVFHPVAVHFKGSGFYTTDYARKTSSPASSSDGPSAKESKKASSKDEKASGKSDSGSKSEGKAKAGA